MRGGGGYPTLNESPSEKEGKSLLRDKMRVQHLPSMKVPPKRKGNWWCRPAGDPAVRPSMKVPPKRKGNEGEKKGKNKPETLNESPSEKEGKCGSGLVSAAQPGPLNESPSEKEGKYVEDSQGFFFGESLNESPSEKEGK